MKSPYKKKLTKVEEALLVLADYLEDVNHDQYTVRRHIVEVLGLDEMKP